MKDRMKKTPLTYKRAGVNIAEAENFVERIKNIVKNTAFPAARTEIGSFGAVFDLSRLRFKKPVLVSSTDGVGTKLKIAFMADKHDTIGIDLVAMNVNDVLTTGAVPLFFLDYIATSRIDKKVLSEVVKGVAEGCRLAGCGLIGGETAEMPGFYQRGEYDLAGFCVGAVEKDKMLNPQDVKKGDVVVGIASSGLHSNGFSLVRKVFTKAEQKKMSAGLLEPTRIYVKPVIRLLEKVNTKSRRAVRAMAHITGGAFYQKAVKVLPEGRAMRVYKNTWVLPEIFRRIEQKAHIEEREMFTTFNMGIGFMLVVDKKKADKAIKHLAAYKLKSWVIGEIVGGKREVVVL